MIKRFVASLTGSALLFASAPAAMAMMPVTPELSVVVHGPATPQSVPPGSQSVQMLQLDLRNESNGDIQVQTLNIRRRGLGDRLDIDGIYLVDDSGVRVSDRFAFQRDGTSEVRIWPPLIVPSDDTVTVHVLADFSRTAAISGEHRLWLAEPADIDTGDDTEIVVTQGEAATGLIRTAGGSVRSAIDVDYPGLNERIRYGKNRLVGRIRLTADGDDDKLVSSVTLTNQGSARGKDLQNIVIENNRGERLSNKVAMLGGRTKDTVTLVFDPPLPLEESSSMILNVRADALASRRKTIQLTVEEASDIRATAKGR